MDLVGLLTSKFHNLIHYPDNLDLKGPAVLHWSMRYEGNNQRLKKNSVSSAGSVNVKMSIATKQAIKVLSLD